MSGDNRKLIAYTVQAASAHLFIAALSPLLAFVLTTGSRGLFKNPVSLTTGNVFSEVHLYFVYASQAMAGEVPYRDYMVEYPPLSFPLFLLPRLFAGSLLSYAVIFILQMVLINAVAIYVIGRVVERRWGIERVPDRFVWYTLFLLALSPMAFSKFDLAPMTLAFAAALAWFSGKNRLGGILAGIGTLVKVFPAVIAGLGLLLESRTRKVWRWRGTLAFLLTAGLGSALWLMLSGSGVRNSLRYHMERGLEIESLYSGLLMIVAKISGAEVSWVWDHGSFQLLTPWSDSFAALAFPLQAAALLVVMWRFYRSGMGSGVQYCGAAVLAFVITGKVLSPQFLIWLFPFITLLDGALWRKGRWIFLACCLTSTMIFPWLFVELLNFAPIAVGVLNLRNLLLLYLLFLLLRRGGRERVGKS
jgi:hypothetical protein